MMDGERQVVVFRKDLLPISETFISTQMASYQRWAPVLVGYRRVAGLDIDGIPHRTLFDGQRVDNRIRMKLDQYGSLAGRQSKRLDQMLAKIKPDLVHAHFGYDAILAAPSVARAGLPMVVTLHGTDILRDWSAWASGDMGFFFRFYPRTIRRLFADPRIHFLAVSEALRIQAIER
ncbi:MAG: glycosyltransferase, partial [Janthinobacterium lividum]